MEITRIRKEAFSVIGKEGATNDGSGFIARLWEDANGHFSEVQPLAKTDENGVPVGVWGAMTDFSRSFLPWEDGFSRGLYLAGVECRDDAQAPAGWTKWDIPGFVYLRFPADTENAFMSGLAYLAGNNLSLVGAVHDFTDPSSGKSYLYFPIEKLG